MELKKNPRVDIHRKSGLYFNVALVIVLFWVIAAFEWTTYDDVSRIDLEVNKADINQLDPVKVSPKVIAPPKPQPIETTAPEKKKTLAEEMEDLEYEVDMTVDLEFP
ncbi:MAG TPA: hypothetical protein DCS93_35235 [Microscillaceae bacterium]|nr:hypothetical protein [Microscillaceae bacterium]